MDDFKFACNCTSITHVDVNEMMRNVPAAAVTEFRIEDARPVCVCCQRELRPADVVNRLSCNHVAHLDCTIVQVKKYGILRCKADDKCFAACEIKCSDTFVMPLSALSVYGQKLKQTMKKLRTLEVKAARMEEELIESLYRDTDSKNTTDMREDDAIMRQFIQNRLESLNVRFVAVAQKNISIAMSRHKILSEDDNIFPISLLRQEQKQYFVGKSGESANNSPWFGQDKEKIEKETKNSSRAPHLRNYVERSIIMATNPLENVRNSAYSNPSVGEETPSEDTYGEAGVQDTIAFLHPVFDAEKKRQGIHRGSSSSESDFYKMHISPLVQDREKNEFAPLSTAERFSTRYNTESSAVLDEQADTTSPQGGLTSWSPNEGLDSTSNRRIGPFCNISPTNHKPVNRSLVFTASLQNTNASAKIRPQQLGSISPVQKRAPRKPSRLAIPAFQSPRICEIECKEPTGQRINGTTEKGSHERIVDREVDGDDLSTLLSRRLKEKRFHGMTLSGRTNTDPFNMYLMSKELTTTPGSMRSPAVQGSVKHLERMRDGTYYNSAASSDNGFSEGSNFVSYATGYSSLGSEEHRNEPEHSCLDQECKDLKCLIGKSD